MAEVRTTQALKPKVNPRKWTTKVNIAIAIAVLVVVLVGLGYGIYASRHQEEIQEDVTPAGSTYP